MLTLKDKIGKTIAYLYNNLIIDLHQNVVRGILLGDCVFNVDGKIVGKLVNNYFYNLNGEITAQKLIISGQESIKNIAEFYRQAWSIASKVKNHLAPWIECTLNWSKVGLQEILHD